MSQKNVEVVRSIFARWELGDFTSAEWMHPEIEFVGADGIAARGIDELGGRWSDFLGIWDHFVVLSEEMIDAGDEQVLVFVRFQGRGRGSRTPIEDFSGANLFSLREGKVVRLVLYSDKSEALKAAGLANEP